MKSATLMRRAGLPLLAALLGLAGARGAAAQRDRVLIPEDTVLRARLSEALSSKDARTGQRFAATLSPDDRSGLPEGTRFEGIVTEVTRPTKSEPGALGMEFRRVILPDGQEVAFRGGLGSLGEEDVRRAPDGRFVARKKGDKFNAKWLGYGAAGGAVLGTILGGNVLKGALLGGLGGGVYGYLNKDKGGASDVNLAAGTEFGIRLDQSLAFNQSSRYRYSAREQTPVGERVAGTREVRRLQPVDARFNDRPVEFAELRPMTLNGELFVPLAPIARAANMRFDQQPGDDAFTLATERGLARAAAGDSSVLMPNDDRPVSLQTAPISIDGEIYVNTEFLSRVADLRVNWDRQSRRLTLESYR